MCEDLLEQIAIFKIWRIFGIDIVVLMNNWVAVKEVKEEEMNERRGEWEGQKMKGWEIEGQSERVREKCNLKKEKGGLMLNITWC